MRRQAGVNFGLKFAKKVELKCSHQRKKRYICEVMDVLTQ